MLRKKLLLSIMLSILLTFPALAGNTFSNKKKNHYKLLTNEKENDYRKYDAPQRIKIQTKEEQFVLNENELNTINENITQIKLLQFKAIEALALLAEQRDLHPWEDLGDEIAASYSYSYAYASIALEKVNCQLEIANKSTKLKNGVELSKTAKINALRYTEQVLKYASYL